MFKKKNINQYFDYVCVWFFIYVYIYNVLF